MKKRRANHTSSMLMALGLTVRVWTRAQSASQIPKTAACYSRSDPNLAASVAKRQIFNRCVK